MRAQLRSLIAAIVDDNPIKARQLLEEDKLLTTLFVAEGQYESRISHWIYANDTALHVAAAGHRVEIAKLLLQGGADVTTSRNHPQRRPLRYAVDSRSEDTNRQVAMLRCLIEAGAAIDAQDK